MTGALLDDLEERDWDWLTPVTPWWSWGKVGEFWLTRELLSLLRDSRLTNWQEPEREPVCIIDDLAQLAARRTRGITDSARALAIGHKPRVVIATLQAVHVLQLLFQLRLSQWTNRAREQGIPWNELLRFLQEGQGDRSVQRDGAVATRQGVEKWWKSIDAGEVLIARWAGGPFLNRFDEVVSMLAAEMIQDIEEICVPDIPALIALERGAKTEQERWQARTKRQGADAQAVWQQMWEDWTEQQCTALASVASLVKLQMRARDDQTELVYEARRRKVSWDDIGLALGMSRQAAHERYSYWVTGTHEDHLIDELRYKVGAACVVASEILKSPNASAEDKESARRFYSPTGPKSAYYGHDPGCCL